MTIFIDDENLYLFLLCLNCTILFSQYNKRTVIQDFNYDNIRDTIQSQYNGGGSFGGTYAEAINGKTNSKIKLDLFNSYALIKYVVQIPNSYYSDDNKLFLKQLLKEILPEERKTTDKTLNWCLNSQLSKHSTERKSKYFKYTFNPNINWDTKKIKVPKPYYTYISQDSINRLYSSRYEKGHIKQEDHKNILVYHPYSLKKSKRPRNKPYKKPLKDFELITSSKEYKIFTSGHAVYIQKGNLYKWLFINDYDTVGRPEKLRWDSIGNIRLIGNHVIIEQNTPPDTRYSVFVIDIRSGIVGKLKYSFLDKDRFENPYKEVLLKETSILYNDGKKTEEISFEDIFKEFKTILKLN